MPKNIVDERNELLRLGRVTPQIPGQEDTLKLLQQKDFANEASLLLILAQLDTKLSTLRDALRGASDKNFTTLETDTEAILARLQGDTGFYGAVSVATIATEIQAANASRKEFLIYNNGVAIFYLGSNDSVTIANGIPIVPHQGASGRIYKGALWGIVSAGLVNVRWWRAV